MPLTIIAFFLFSALWIIGFLALRTSAKHHRSRFLVVLLHGSPEDIEFRVRRILFREHLQNGNGNYRLLLISKEFDEDTLKICRLLKRSHPAVAICRTPSSIPVSCEMDDNTVY